MGIVDDTPDRRVGLFVETRVTRDPVAYGAVRQITARQSQPVIAVIAAKIEMASSVLALERNGTEVASLERAARRLDLRRVSLDEGIDAGGEFSRSNLADGLALLCRDLLGELLANGKLGPVADDRRELWNETEGDRGGRRNRHEQQQRRYRFCQDHGRALREFD